MDGNIQNDTDRLSRRGKYNERTPKRGECNILQRLKTNLYKSRKEYTDLDSSRYEKYLLILVDEKANINNKCNAPSRVQSHVRL